MEAIEKGYRMLKSEQLPMWAQGVAHITEGFLVVGAQRGTQGEPPLHELGPVVPMHGPQLPCVMVVLHGQLGEVRRLLLRC